MKGILISVGIGLQILVQLNTYAQKSDSASVQGKKSTLPRNYIRTCFYANLQALPGRTVRHKKVNDHFGYSQANVGFYTPLYTKTWESANGLRLPSFQLLATGNLQILRAQFSASERPETFSKLTLGVRGILSTGGKSVFFFYFSPFLAHNQFLSGQQRFRFTAMLLYNRTVSQNFSYQIGVNRTYLFGNAFWMPLIGIRIGRLDRFHVQLAFPRNFSLNLPINAQWMLRAFTKVSGGAYSLQNFDSLYTGLSGNQILFGMSEVLTGVEIDFNPGRTVSLFVTAGISSARRIGFYENGQEIGNYLNLSQNFIKLPPAGFIQAGIAIRIGRARTIYNNSSMYDAAEMNSIFDPGDINTRVPGRDIPSDPDKANLNQIRRNQLRDLKDYFYDE